MALSGRKRIPWLLATFRDFDPPAHVPRTLARAHTCTAVFMRASCVPRNREHEKRPAGGRAKNADVQKKSIWYWYIVLRSNIYIAAYRILFLSKWDSIDTYLFGLFCTRSQWLRRELPSVTGHHKYFICFAQKALPPVLFLFFHLIYHLRPDCPAPS